MSVSQPKPFVLFFDIEHVKQLIKKYRMGWRGRLSDALLKEAEAEGFKVHKVSKNDLPDFTDNLKEIGEQKSKLGDFAKGLFAPAVIGPFLMNWSIKVTDCLKFEDSESIMLVFFFRPAGVFKSFISGIAAFPNKTEDKQSLFQYFRSLVSGVSSYPFSENSWKEIENYRIGMAAAGVKQTVQFDGLLENFWEKVF